MTERTMSSNATATARRSKQLQELVDGKHFKQALSLCEKSFKKGDKSEDLRVTWVNILLGHPDPARREQGDRALDEIFGQPHPISDIEALVALNAAANARNDHDPRIQTIWERAAGVRQWDESFYRTWFKTKFLERKWPAAQKAAMMYMKKFPLSREPFFWNIITCELAGAHPRASETDKTILRPLAYRFISKAVADVSADNAAPSSVRALNSLEDIFLLLEVYRSQKRYEEALKVLDDPLTGITSQLGNNSWELVRQKIELFELCDRWQDGWKFCAELLMDAHPENLQSTTWTSSHPFGKFGDDWKVWLGLLSASDMLGTSENSKVTRELIDYYFKPRTVSRNARLALLRYYLIESVKNAQVQDKLLSACREYFIDYCPKVICFRDLQPYVSRLDKPLQEKFLGLVARDTKGLVCGDRDSQSKKLEWVTSEINVLKLDYYLFVSLDSTPDRRLLLRAFVRNCLRLYRVSLSIGITVPVSERRPGDDAAMLAVMALLRLRDLGERNVIFQCIAILEFLLAGSKHNYDALLTLVRLYMNLGAASLAIQRHSRLSIKNLQHATISWILYTRISTLHPYGAIPNFSNETPIDSSKNLSLAIDWHKSAEGLNSISISRMLDNGQYRMLFDVLETDRCIKNGLAKFLFVVESHRIGRFSNFSEIKDYSRLLDERDPPAEDTRDTTAFPDAEADGQFRFETYLTSAPKPDHFWLESQYKLVELSRFLQKNRVENRVESNDWLYLRTDADSISKSHSFTPIEGHAARLVNLLRHLCIAFRLRGPHSSEALAIETVPAILTSLMEWYTFTNKRIVMNVIGLEERVPLYLYIDNQSLDWAYFHVFFTLLDIFQVTMQVLDHALVENCNFKIVDHALLEAVSSEIKGRIVQDWGHIHERASALLQRLRAPGTAAKMVENTIKGDESLIACDLNVLIGVSGLEETATKICLSWAEGLEGILRTKPR